MSKGKRADLRGTEEMCGAGDVSMRGFRRQEEERVRERERKGRNLWGTFWHRGIVFFLDPLLTTKVE